MVFVDLLERPGADAEWLTQHLVVLTCAASLLHSSEALEEEARTPIWELRDLLAFTIRDKLSKNESSGEMKEEMIRMLSRVDRSHEFSDFICHGVFQRAVSEWHSEQIDDAEDILRWLWNMPGNLEWLVDEVYSNDEDLKAMDCKRYRGHGGRD